jgi:opacity protein-like surface antigen
MRAIPRAAIAVASLALIASPLSAQSFSFGLRGTGTFPTGTFADPQVSSSSELVAGAKSGFGYGLDVGLDLGPVGLYAGFDHVHFGCETAACSGDEKYTLQGVTLGLKVASATTSGVRPFVKGGITFNNLEGSYGTSTSQATPFTTDKAPGFELGVGVDVGLLGIVSLTPQVRYVGQNLKLKVPGVSAPTSSTQGVNYFTFDLGLSVHPPFGGIH